MHAAGDEREAAIGGNSQARRNRGRRGCRLFFAYRMGLHLGIVLVDNDDILVESINIAARLEGIAGPGGDRISGSALEHVRGRIGANFWPTPGERT
jgi:class 3 adenylate cyclase